MKNSVTILQTLRSGGKFQQGNSRVGNSLRASFLASVPFCFLRIHPFLSADLLCPLKKVHPQGLSTIWWHWISSVFPWRLFPWHLPRDSGPCLASPRPDACRVQHLSFPAGSLLWHLQSSAPLVSCPPAASCTVSPRSLQGALIRERLSSPVSRSHWAHWAVTQACVGPHTFPFELEAAWGPRECSPHIRGQGLLVFVMNLPQ